MGEEKYISIDYDLWLSKYKPLEHENMRLKDELEKSKIKIDIVLQTSYNAYGKYLGHIDIRIDSPEHFRLNFHNSDEILMDEVKKQINRIGGTHLFASKIEVEGLIRSIQESSKEYQKSFNEYISRKDNIPRFIKWLFKIK